MEEGIKMKSASATTQFLVIKIFVLLQSATKQRNSTLLVTATCRSTPTALHLCVTPRSGVWGVLNSKMAWIPKKAKKRRSRRLW